MSPKAQPKETPRKAAPKKGDAPKAPPKSQSNKILEMSEFPTASVKYNNGNKSNGVAAKKKMKISTPDNDEIQQVGEVEQEQPERPRAPEVPYEPGPTLPEPEYSLFGGGPRKKRP